jgi:hypothetical protein
MESPFYSCPRKKVNKTYRKVSMIQKCGWPIGESSKKKLHLLACLGE